jgi:hypothetical protein
MRDRRHDDARSPLIVGVILLVVGAGLLAANLGFSFPENLWRFWPFVLIVPGLLATLAPSRHMSRAGGIWLLATGVYGLCGMYRPFGLGWGGAWPIFIVAAGFTMIFSERDRTKNDGAAVPDAPRDTASKNERSSHA